jgi:hypothetical protein
MSIEPRNLQRKRALLGALAALFAFAGSEGVARAHFRLIAPGNVVMQGADGSPQKSS